MGRISESNAVAKIVFYVIPYSDFQMITVITRGIAVLFTLEKRKEKNDAGAKIT